MEEEVNGGKNVNDYLLNVEKMHQHFMDNQSGLVK